MLGFSTQTVDKSLQMVAIFGGLLSFYPRLIGMMRGKVPQTEPRSAGDNRVNRNWKYWQVGCRKPLLSEKSGLADRRRKKEGEVSEDQENESTHLLFLWRGRDCPVHALWKIISGIYMSIWLSLCEGTEEVWQMILPLYYLRGNQSRYCL